MDNGINMKNIWLPCNDVCRVYYCLAKNAIKIWLYISFHQKNITDFGKDDNTPCKVIPDSNALEENILIYAYGEEKSMTHHSCDGNDRMT